MKSYFLSIFIAGSSALKGHGENGVDFVVPAGSGAQDGNTYSVYPVFPLPNTVRYQQVYAASEFASLTNVGGGSLISIHFRGDATNGTQLGVKLPSLQVNLSTTERGPDQLSPQFADNIGADDTVVFSGALETNLVGGHGDGPEVFSFEILLFSRPFFYNPAKGNLLLDIRVFQGNTNTNGMIEARFDACNVTKDSVSRVYGGNVNATSGSVDTLGLVTDFNVWRNPKLSVEQRTDSVVLTWPANPPWVALPETLLQTKQDFAVSGQWQTVTNGITQTNLVNTFTIPLDAAATQAYFRLVSTTSP